MARIASRTSSLKNTGSKPPQPAGANDLSPSASVMLVYIDRFQEKYAYPPSVRQIMDALQLRSTSTVHACLKRLQGAGYLAPRASPRQLWRILRLPPTLSTPTSRSKE